MLSRGGIRRGRNFRELFGKRRDAFLRLMVAQSRPSQGVCGATLQAGGMSGSESVKSTSTEEIRRT